MNNLLDWALDFEQNATEQHYIEAFGDDARSSENICHDFGIMALYAWLSPSLRQRFATYLIHRYAIINNPAAECVPMSDFACFPDTDTEIII